MQRALTAFAMATPLCACTATAPVQLPESQLNALFDDLLAPRFVGRVMVTSYAGSSLEGGNLMHPVTMSGGSTAAVLM